jgi:hypothetical protein
MTTNPELPPQAPYSNGILVTTSLSVDLSVEETQYL